MACPRLLTAFPVDGALAQMAHWRRCRRRLPHRARTLSRHSMPRVRSSMSVRPETRASSPGCSASRSRPSFSTTRRSAAITPGQPGSMGTAARHRQGGRQRARRDGGRHSLAQAGRREPPRKRDARGCHHRAADQQSWRRRPRRVRSGRCLSQRPLFSRLRFPQRAQITPRAEAS
jgi:hypothetical protein